MVRELPDVWSYSKLKHKLETIEPLRDKALLCLVYATGVRASEVKVCPSDKLTLARIEGLQASKLNPSDLMGVRRRNVWTEEIIKNGENFGEFLIITVPTRKNRRDFVRTIPLNTSFYKSEKCVLPEGWLTEPILKWIELSNLRDEALLFSIGKRRIEQIVRFHFGKGFFPHWLRHCRATHLVQNKRFVDAQLTKFMGWSSSQPARVYTHLRTEDLI